MTKENTLFDWLQPKKRLYVKEDLKVRQWADVSPYFEELQKRPVGDLTELRKWLADWSELESVLHEEGTDREIRMTCDTENEAIKKAHLDFIENFVPPLKEAHFELCEKYYSTPARSGLGSEYEQLDQAFANQIELFKKENVEIEKEIDKLAQNYQELTGGWMVSFEGTERTMPEMFSFLQLTDRSRREGAWRAMAARRIQDRETLDGLYDNLFQRRQRVAKNLGLSDYRAYIFKRNRREYTPEDCFQFHEAVEKSIVPLVKTIREDRRKKMKLDSLRPWDLSCDAEGREPLKPFTKVLELQDGVEEIFKRVNPLLKDYFHSIRPYQDLDSRKGKAPGGYQATYSERCLPFIFTNAAGVQGDVETLLHEAGHSFHTLQFRGQPLLWYRDAPMEFCEVASMSQELIGGEHFGVFYQTEEEARRARQEHLEDVLELFPWVMTVDAFQHWVYTHDGHTPEARNAAWLKEHQRFDAGVDWSGLEEFRAPFWQKQLHIFLDPFYYIEYAISQLGALQIYRNYQKNADGALKKFLSAMALGRSRSCKEIFTEAGIEFRFDGPFVKELAEMVFEELKR